MLFYPQLQDEGWLREQAKTKTCREIAEEVGCSQGAVMCAVKRHGVTLPHPNRRGDHAPYILYHKLQDRVWLEEQIKLKSARQIAEEVGCSTSAVRTAVNQKFGMKMPKRTGAGTGANYFRFEKLQDRVWLEDAISKRSLRAVATEVGCSYGAVVSAKRKFCIAVPQRLNGFGTAERISAGVKGSQRPHKVRLGADAGNWRGGRILVGTKGKQYVYIYEPDHPYATADGYVMEHRLVVERRLGRYLEPTELVHHKNGNRLENGDENLEVASSKAEHWQFHFDAMKEVEAARLKVIEMGKELAILREKLAGSVL